MELVTNAKSSKIKRVILWGAFTLIVLALLTVVGISLYVGWDLTHPEREIINETPSDYGLVFKNISFRSNLDNVKLIGWWVPAQENQQVVLSAKTVIFAHGYADSKSQKPVYALNLAKRLAFEGYNILLFDFRNSGESGGDLTSVGCFEKHDLLAAINYANKVQKSEQIALIGWSMGASTAITAGIESPLVKAIVADSPFADLRDYLESNMSVWSDLPNIPFTPIIMQTIPLLTGIDPEEVSPYREVERLGGRGLLLIHSKGDKTTPYQNSQQIYDAVSANSPAEFWLTEKADHIRSYLLYKEEYEARVLRFLGQYLN